MRLGFKTGTIECLNSIQGIGGVLLSSPNVECSKFEVLLVRLITISTYFVYLKAEVYFIFLLMTTPITGVSGELLLDDQTNQLSFLLEPPLQDIVRSSPTSVSDAIVMAPVQISVAAKLPANIDNTKYFVI